MTDTAGKDAQASDAPREASFLLAAPERRFLHWAAARLPARVLPDHLTALGVVAALGVGACYLLSNESSAWLWAASALLVVHWLGDSLDGTLARVRRIERPRYGYYLDHLTDALATVVIGLGLGLSPYMLLSVGLAIVIVYLVMSINVYLEASSLRVFRLGYGRFGPTEARIVLVAINTMLALGIGQFRVDMVGLSAFDVVGLGLVAAMGAMLVVRAVRNLRTLRAEEPSARRRASRPVAGTPS